MTPAPESPDAALVERLRGGVFGLNRIALCQEAATTITRLTAERDAALRDAERYRWLRGRVPGGAYRIMGVIYSEGGAGVDAAIDAAMAQERGNV